jgi:hypothetical protein
LFAVFPVLFLYGRNMAELKLTTLVVPLVLVTVAAVLLTLLFERMLGRGLKAALVVSGLLVMFFSYGHVYEWINSSFSVRHRFLEPLWIVCWVPLLVAIARSKSTLEVLDRTATVVAATLVATTLLTIASFVFNPTSHQASPPLAAANISARTVDVPLPDIYYIVLDAYAAEPVLRDLYGYDNGAFLRGLERRGFRVMERSRSNYSMTLPSTVGTLNMDYLEHLTPADGNAVEQHAPAVRADRQQSGPENLGGERLSHHAHRSATRDVLSRLPEHAAAYDDAVLPRLHRFGTAHARCVSPSVRRASHGRPGIRLCARDVSRTGPTYLARMASRNR